MKIQLNQDTELVKEIKEKLEKNDKYCPCKLIKSEATKCMCEEFLNSSEIGFCHCGLYEKVEI